MRFFVGAAMKRGMDFNGAGSLHGQPSTIHFSYGARLVTVTGAAHDQQTTECQIHADPAATRRVTAA